MIKRKIISLINILNLYYFNLINSKEKQRIKSFKNIHEGERCFIIGNGPSLSTDDLNKIKGEVTFSCNMIFDIINKTEWKPYYYFSHDPGYLKKFKKKIFSLDAKSKFIGYYFETAIIVKNDYYKKGRNHIYEINKKNDKYENIDFSKDVSKCVYPCGSVSYAMIQFAVYMGFKEIYLLGFDHTLGLKTGNTHFEGYSGNKTTNVDVDNITLGFIKAKEISEISDFEIFNSTRGGLLEVFKRKPLEEVIYA